jgi:hypothetical protein
VSGQQVHENAIEAAAADSAVDRDIFRIQSGIEARGVDSLGRATKVFKVEGNIGRETVRNASAADDVVVDRAVGGSTSGSRRKRGRLAFLTWPDCV